jgi:hypothetical protein
MALIKLGSSGPEIRSLQEKLRILNLMSSPPSATFDAITQKAVIEFQNRHPWLKIDGIVGPKTLADINESILRLEGESLLQRFAADQAPIGTTQLRANAALALAIQRRLNMLGLYPGGKLLDGDFGIRSQSSLQKFCKLSALGVETPFLLTPKIATALIETSSLDPVFEQAKDLARMIQIYRDFEKASEANEGKLALLDMGAELSPFRESLYRSQEFIQQTTSAGFEVSEPGQLGFADYPFLGSLPKIKSFPSTFFGSDITEACVCLGEIKEGRLLSSWFGHNALDLVECWSASKVIPILNVYSQLGGKIPDDSDALVLRNIDNPESQFQLKSVCVDICTYRDGVSKSNALAATLNAFEADREKWIRSQTGNKSAISFGGRYRDQPLIINPDIFDNSSDRELLQSRQISEGGNMLSVYDLTRFISLLGWHQILPPSQKLPNLAKKAYQALTIIFATDTARYVDIALATLGVANRIQSLSVLSKLGYGYSEFRNVTEMVYTAFVQFADQHISANPKLRSLAMTFRCSLPGSGDEVAIQADTAIAVAVTELLRRVISEDFS